MGKNAAIIAGTVAGVVVGGDIGRWMDSVDQGCAAQAMEYAGSSRRVEWVNPDNGAVYQVTPTETYRDRYCREYQATATIGGKREDVYGTACRKPDGSWKLVNN
jgi:surface antigen